MIGPHEKIELELMVAGIKPAAVITERQQLLRFVPFVASGLFVSQIGKFSGDRGYFVAIVQAGEEDRLKRLVEIFSSSKRPHEEIGELLGYRQEDIDHFMRHLEAVTHS